MNNPKQLIIIGSGPSLKEGIDKGLWNKLIGKYTYGINFIYQYFIPTVLTFVDYGFYMGVRKKIRNEQQAIQHRKAIKELPFIIGAYDQNLKYIHSNTILLRAYHTYYGKKSLKKNLIYKSNLTGLFSLTLGINLLDIEEIFLLGFDGGANLWFDKTKAHTHFCQSDPNAIVHDGYGKVGYYEIKDKTKKDYEVYKDIETPKIYNVSPNSRISGEIIPKITYDQFFEKLDHNTYDQNALRRCIRDELYKEIPRHTMNYKVPTQE